MIYHPERNYIGVSRYAAHIQLRAKTNLVSSGLKDLRQNMELELTIDTCLFVYNYIMDKHVHI